jgi:hypothetical protein
MRVVGPIRRRWRTSACFCAALLVGAWLTAHAWDWLCGNERFSFYGRVVDESGHGIPGVRVDAELLYSSSIVMPTFFGRSERKKGLSTVTDGQGNYEFTRLTGYAISIWRVSKPGFKLLDATPPPYPPSSWSAHNASSWRSLPDRPSRRDVSPYRLVSSN